MTYICTLEPIKCLTSLALAQIVESTLTGLAVILILSDCALLICRSSIRSEESNHLMTNGRSSMNSMNSVEMGGKKLTPIAETPTSGTHIPYKMQKVLVEGKMIPCINLKPFVMTELLVTLPDIIQHFFNPVPLGNCRRVMDVLGIELYRGNR